MVYTPGLARASLRPYTPDLMTTLPLAMIKKNTVAVVTDGTALLGVGPDI